MFKLNGSTVSDLSTVPNVWLYVGAGKSPTPFLPAGKFTTTWEGFLNAELRSTYLFQAVLNGSLEVEINGAVAIETESGGGASPLTKPVQLSKGPNPFRATFTSPVRGDALVRLGWTEKGTNTAPIADSAFTHTTTPELARAAERYLGRELFFESRCVKCHTGASADAAVPELQMDAPSLEGIGARRHFEWMARWILDPKSVRPAAHMPKLLHGTKAKEDAEAIAAYLFWLKDEPLTKFSAPLVTRQNTPAEGDGAPSSGEPKPLYERLHCAGCHNPPDATEIDPKKLSQKGIGTKFPQGKLAAFLRAPEAHYAWTRMPNFRLSEAEAKELEAYLLGASEKPKAVTAPADPATIGRGKSLLQTAGCLNCHKGLKLDYQFKAPPLDALVSSHRKDRQKLPPGDCLGATPAADYGFTGGQRAALDLFTLDGLPSLTRHVPAEFAQRQTRLLNCSACHGQIDLVPPLEILGGKLKPEWAAEFIAGDIPHKIRFDAHPKGEPWVAARMPGFKTRATWLAEGLAELHGYPPKSPAEPPVDMDLAKAGQKLVGKDGGFSCVSCHAVGPLLALEVFESEGVNFAWSADRLQPDYYRRWIRNPLAIDPQTKMPVYFDEEGRSPLTEILDGNGDRQLDAVWEYLRLRDKMPSPKTGAE